MKVSLALLVILVWAFTSALSNTQDGGIIVEDAELVVETPNVYSPELGNLVANMSPRFVVQYGEGVRPVSLPPLPGSLQTWLGQVQARVVIQHAEGNRQYPLVYPVALPQDGLPSHLHYSVVYLPMIRR